MTRIEGTILCATRGGESSLNTQQYAIDMAREREVDVLFLYVSNVEFMHNVPAVKLHDLQAELDKMGEFLLLMAKERAGKQGVAAETIIKRGHFREALIETAQHTTASLIVMGTPADDSITARAYLDRLKHNLEDETGIEVTIVEDPEDDD